MHSTESGPLEHSNTMAPFVKELADKPRDLNSKANKPKMVQGENIFLQVVL